MPLFLRKSGSKPIFRSLNDELRQAAGRGDTDQVFELIQKGAKFIPNKDGRNALHLAAMHGHVDVVRALIEHGCDLNCQDKLGYTALHRACLEGHTEVVRLLVDTNLVNVDKQDVVQENGALHDAAWHGRTTIVELLLCAKANVYVRNKTGATALHLACQNGHSQSTRLLLQHGCKPDVKDKYDDTPLHTACRYIHAGVVRLLVSSHAKVNEQNKNGDTALHLACNLSQKKISRVLVDGGAKIDIKNKQGETPADIASRKQLGDLLERMRTAKPTKVNDRATATAIREKKNKIRERLQAAKEHGSTWQLLFQDWAPYGMDAKQRPCQHLYPVESGFTSPQTHPVRQLENGEQYFIDLAGNVHKGPVACYCAPFFYHLAKHSNETHLELLEEIDACQNNLSNEISDLRQATERKIVDLNRQVKVQRLTTDGTRRNRMAWHRLVSTTKKRLDHIAAVDPLKPGRLVRSKSESEIETDVERGRAHAAVDLRDSDSLSNASDDLYFDRRWALADDVRTSAVPEAVQRPRVQQSPPNPRRTSPVSAGNQAAVGAPQAFYDETARRFNKLELDSFRDSSCTTPTTTGSLSSRHCTPDTSIRSSIYSSQSAASNLSASQLSNSKSLQPSLDSGYSAGSAATTAVDEAAASWLSRSGVSGGRWTAINRPCRVDSQTQTEPKPGQKPRSEPVHEYTELECMLRSGTGAIPTANVGGGVRLPPTLPIPPPPRKPLPPLPIASPPSRRSIRIARCHRSGACLSTNV